jgi:hypothetical protein
VHYFLLLAVLMLGLSACKTKRVLEKSPLVNLSDKALLELVNANTFEFSSLNGKMSVTADTKQQSGAFKINLRMRADSAIWMSITPALGIEAARALIEPDSLKYIDKIKNTYYVGAFDILDSLINYYAEFELVQNLLTGNPIQINPEEKYTSEVDGLYYVLTTKVKRKVRKSIEDVRDTAGVVSFEVLKERKFEKAKEKFDDEDLILKKYYVRPGDFKVVNTQIDDVMYKRSLRVEYKTFIELEGQLIPTEIKITASSPGQNAKFELSYLRIRLNELQTYPFKIPSKYSPIR